MGKVKLENIMANTPTQRQYRNIETNEVFRLFMDDDTKEYSLIKDKGNANFNLPEGTEVNGWYLSAHTPMSIKLNNKKVIDLDRGTFYNLREGEEVTHKKYLGFKRFTKEN